MSVPLKNSASPIQISIPLAYKEMNKQKLLFFIESLSGGGAEQVLVTMLRHFDYEKYDVTLLTVSDVGVHLDDIDRSKVHYRTIIPRRQNALSSIWYKIKYKMLYQYLPAWLVAKLIIPSGFDTYIAFVEGYCTKIIGQLSSLQHKIAYVHIDLKNHPWTLQKNIYKSLEEEKRVYFRFDKTVCVSHSVEDVMKSYYGLNNTTTIYNPIDVDWINSMAREKVGFLPSAGFNIVSVGRLVPQKGYDLLIPIIGRLRREGMNVCLYILGEGECRDSLVRQIESLSLQEYVHLMGYHKNPHAIVRKMDLFVCSSRAEGYSLVIAEALSLGVPVVSTNCSGPNELLANGMYGVLCDDYDQMYVSIKQLIQKRDQIGVLRDKALIRSKSLGVKNTIQQLEYLLENDR